MGTRNLTIVKVDGKTKVAQYGQWDGYPTGQGFTIADFIQNELDLRKFKAAVRKLKWITSKDLENRWAECGADDSGFVTMDVSEVFRHTYPFLSRDVGAGVLSIIQTGKYTDEKYDYKTGKTTKTIIEGLNVDRLKNDRAFIKDSLFCEWAYEIDLDKKTVKVYEGFQKLPNDKYGACKVVRTYKFKEFTREAMEKLEKELNDEEDCA